MPEEINLGQWLGIKFSARPSAVASSAGLCLGLGLFVNRRFKAPVFQALFAGLVTVALHWFTNILHQLGHALVARTTGYPLSKIRLYGLLGSTLYPEDEPELPPSTHLLRASGGPLASALVTLLIGMFLRKSSRSGKVARAVTVYLFLVNLLVFTLGAILPLNFTDGGVFLKYLGKGKQA